LFAGTCGTNNADRKAKGRSHRPVGETHPQAALTDDDIRAMRARVLAGEARKAVAAAYSIHRNYLDQIVRRVRWSHV
jgi:hypothetical protein